MSKLGMYGILIVLAAFIVLMIFNPNLSCFGKRVRSPFYPLQRKKKKAALKTTDYDFHLVEGPARKPGVQAGKETPKPDKKTDDYGFKLD